MYVYIYIYIYTHTFFLCHSLCITLIATLAVRLQLVVTLVCRLHRIFRMRTLVSGRLALNPKFQGKLQALTLESAVEVDYNEFLRHIFPDQYVEYIQDPNPKP